MNEILSRTDMCMYTRDQKGIYDTLYHTIFIECIRLVPAQDAQFALIIRYVTKKSYFLGINTQLKREIFKVCVVCKNILPGI